MIYLFLDIDGVLNNYDTTERCQGFIGIDPDKVKLLKHIIDVTHAEIILTSTWKYEWEPIDKTKNEYAGDYWTQHLRRKVSKLSIRPLTIGRIEARESRIG